jgi:RNA polymerase sigma factor for flagellar operon FliA
MKPIDSYRRGGATDASVDQDRLVAEHAPLVRRIAYHLIARLPPSVEVDDLIQSGIIGLLEAARKFDGSQGASFETYAGIRIRGAMIDHIRPNDWTPRSVARRAREVAAAIHAVEAREGRDAHDSEVMRELGMDADTYHATLRDVASVRLASLETLAEREKGAFTAAADDRDASPELRVMDNSFRDQLAAAIGALPEREQLVMSLYYDDELNLREIGQVLDVSESRVCQIHARAVVRLRDQLAGWLGDAAEAQSGAGGGSAAGFFQAG